MIESVWVNNSFINLLEIVPRNGKQAFILERLAPFAAASFSFLSATKDYEKLAVTAQKEILKQQFSDAGWEARRILADLENNPDIYFDAISQVIAPIWSKRRCAMTGDAVFCPSSLIGMGVSLSILRAYIPAGELSRYADYQQAFAEYEKVFRPYVTKIQKLPPGVSKLAHPKTKPGISIFNTVINIISSKLVKKIRTLFANKKKSSANDSIILPDYWKQANA
jgi:2-polyprenyl-6-methoxyphenol hydroxylase-like FAD-dependent oxidoreductase